MSQDDRKTLLRDARERLDSHPGRVEHKRIHALVSTLQQVFEPNYRDLANSLLGVASGDPDLIADMFKNIGRPMSSGETVGRVSRHLHNYVGSTATLVDHARNYVKGNKKLTGELGEQVARITSNPEIPFVKHLRNFAVHRSLLIMQYTLSFTQSGVDHSEVELSAENLLEDDGWTAGSKAFIKSFGDRITLRPIIDKHFELVFNMNAWLINRAQEENRENLSQANELLAEYTAIQAGVDLDEARRMIDGQFRRP